MGPYCRMKKPSEALLLRKCLHLHVWTQRHALQRNLGQIRQLPDCMMDKDINIWRPQTFPTIHSMRDNKWNKDEDQRCAEKVWTPPPPICLSSSVYHAKVFFMYSYSKEGTRMCRFLTKYGGNSIQRYICNSKTKICADFSN